MRILYIDIDSQRPDHLGCYGYHRNTSPAIDAIAAEGLVFENVYAPDAPCLPSRTAFYSGRFGIHTGVVGHGGTAAQPKIQGPGRNFRDTFDEQGLARQLQLLGYHTAMISPFGQRHAAWHFYAGFNEIHNTGQGGMESAEVVQPVVDKWMADHAANDNWFLHINYWDPHTPYRVPADYGDPFANEPLPAWLDSDEVIERHRQMTGPHTMQEIGMYDDRTSPDFPRHPGKITDPASLRRMIDGYDTGVKYVDDQVASIVRQLKTAGVYDETMIVISADHGENLGELGIYGEHGTADQATCRIPLIIKYPGGPKGARNAKFHYNLDLAPTLMDLLSGEKQPLWDGESFAPALTDGADTGRDEVVFSQCAHVCQRSVRWGKWLYLRTYHDGFHLFPQEMLFDLEADPHEQDNLAPARPDLCQEGQWRLSRWHDAQMQRMALNANDVVDPLWTVIREGGPFHARLTDGNLPGQPGNKLATYLEHLENTGRQDGADEIRRKYAVQIARACGHAEP
ncbi:sulfatase [Ruficoccus amylovorans]|uniref:Sulfatase n=1 Tax=Ruficoccus amylovorans TaxID=1804625 RepID=A0A842HDR8_9BACT|nr:sulfatase [Ruficoccus amylovorans]MBC2594582.1 sulfatase [Ruficoccus amylovorans]